MIDCVREPCRYYLSVDISVSMSRYLWSSRVNVEPVQLRGPEVVLVVDGGEGAGVGVHGQRVVETLAPVLAVLHRKEHC